MRRMLSCRSRRLSCTTWDGVSGGFVVRFQILQVLWYYRVVTKINLFFPILRIAASLVLWTGTFCLVRTGGGIEIVLEMVKI